MKHIIDKIKVAFAKTTTPDSTDSNECSSYEHQGGYKEALDFESSVHYMVEQSNKRAYIFAFFCGIICLLSIIALMLLTPLKTTEPYLIRVNDTTGAVDIITILDTEQISNNEALDKHFINSYVRAREGYFYDMLNRDYELVLTLSDTRVAADYKDIYKGENARDKVFKNNIQINVDVLSIVLTESAGVKTATIRTNLAVKNLSSRSIINQYRIITLSYEYQRLALKESLRNINPLGFKVLTYRIDEDIKR